MERQGREQEQYQPKSRPTNIRLKDKRQVMPEAKFITTTASIKLSKMREKYRIIPGGTSAGKTFNIIPIIYSRALLMPNKVFSITSETMPHLRKGAMRDFKNILRMTGRWDRSKWHGTDSIYSLDNGSVIEFFSLDDESKARGPRRDELYVNEADAIKFEIFRQLQIRTRGVVWIDFNPHTEFWVHENLKDHPRAEWLTLTYKDNEALDESLVKEIEHALELGFHDPTLIGDDLFQEENIKNKYWSNWWKVYGLGQLGEIDELILRDWEQVDSIPINAKYIGSGLDFGFNPDPSTLVDMYLYNGQKYFKEIIYERNLGVAELANKIKQDGLTRNIVADRSAPLIISDLNTYGLNVVAYDATDGMNTIESGISILRSDKFHVTSDSLNLIKELRRYIRIDGRIPNNAEDHAIDAMRYIGSTKRNTRSPVRSRGRRPQRQRLR
ncbi:MAG TPA: phage terminase large subunit [Tissierellaceae bacterium]|nr:phage terminase large subunit [Tissierellaceae bacterium]